MSESELSILSLNILEIIAEQRDIHILLVKGQLQAMNESIKVNMDDSDFDQAVHQLEQKGLIRELDTKPKFYILTSEGKNYI